MLNSIKVIKKEIGKLFFVLSREQKIYGIIVFFLSLLAAGLEVVGVGIILPLVTAFLEPDKLMSNSLLVKPIQIFHIQDAKALIAVITIAVIIVFVIKNIFFTFLSWVRIKYSCKVSRELSAQMMATYMKRGYEFFLITNTAELSRNIGADVSGVDTMLTHLLKAIVDIMTIAFIIIYMTATDWILAVSVMILAFACLLLIYFLFRTQMRKAGELFSTYNKITNKYLLQALHGIKEVMVMNKQDFFVKNYVDANIQKQKGSIRQTVGAESPAYMIEGICISGLLGMVCIRILLNDQGAADLVPTLSAFAVGAFRILPSLGRISSAVNTAIYFIPSLNHVYENLHKIQNYNENHGLEILDEEPIKEFHHEVELRNVSWHYSGSDKWILSNLNLKIEKGSSVALIGLSGAGKTTLADIMLGLLPPQKGQVLIDGHDIFRAKGKISHIMGYVPQSVYLTDDTIRNNIAFGIEPDEIDDDKIWHALEQAQLKGFIEQQPKGLDTFVGDRGVRFSGGQRQRIAIARALYLEPEILVFDEATASLDSETETAVMESIQALQGHKTLIIIAHRLTTIKNCDKIYEIENGNAILRTYEEVMPEN
ncbi:MAG: ABC transporter ATP-binding protein [Lachnospiraceae bacterium]|nr:ABC transporter ATP-binding protein [Lachnospiraceae bacterium]